MAGLLRWGDGVGGEDEDEDGKTRRGGRELVDVRVGEVVILSTDCCSVCILAGPWVGNERCFSGTEVGVFFSLLLPLLKVHSRFFWLVGCFPWQACSFFPLQGARQRWVCFWLLDYTFIRAQTTDGGNLVDGRAGANTWAFSSFSFFLSFCNSVLWLWRKRIRFFVHCSFSFSVVSC